MAQKSMAPQWLLWPTAAMAMPWLAAARDHLVHGEGHGDLAHGVGAVDDERAAGLAHDRRPPGRDRPRPG